MLLVFFAPHVNFLLFKIPGFEILNHANADSLVSRFTSILVESEKMKPQNSGSPVSGLNKSIVVVIIYLNFRAVNRKKTKAQLRKI